MSIYATLWVLRFPRRGDYHTGCGWVEVICQGVPAHIGTPTSGYGYEDGDPYAAFLPPAVPVAEDYDDRVYRAVVIVRNGEEKHGQRYDNPLVVMSGAEYAATRFADLIERVHDTLRGDRPRYIGERRHPDGSAEIVFEDGSVVRTTDWRHPPKG
jgi:hypothetical protein